MEDNHAQRCFPILQTHDTKLRTRNVSSLAGTRSNLVFSCGCPALYDLVDEHFTYCYTLYLLTRDFRM